MFLSACIKHPLIDWTIGLFNCTLISCADLYDIIAFGRWKTEASRTATLQADLILAISHGLNVVFFRRIG